ncbi:MAG: hypothetical protein OEY05_13925, partial [Paracoccaceae bacterium]|nr:hypothetical protein [Paracoccaceae bacterium]
GYFSGRLSLAFRLLFVVFGVMALIPAGAFDGALLTDIIGVAGGLALMALEYFRTRPIVETTV